VPGWAANRNGRKPGSSSAIPAEIFQRFWDTPPQVVAFIKIADGGIIHRVAGIAPDQVTIGTLVAADLKPKEERTGSIFDIRAFKPLV